MGSPCNQWLFQLGQEAGIPAHINWNIVMAKDCSNNAKQAHHHLKRLKKHSIEQRELFMDQYAEVAAGGNDTKKEGILKQ